jgi:hypothetical protein
MAREVIKAQLTTRMMPSIKTVETVILDNAGSEYMTAAEELS